MSERIPLFKPDPAEQFPLRVRREPTFAGRIAALNDGLSEELGMPALPYITPNRPLEGLGGNSNVGELFTGMTPLRGEAVGDLAELAPGSLIMLLAKGSAEEKPQPFFAVRAPTDAPLLIAGAQLSRRDGRPAANTNEVAHITQPPALTLRGNDLAMTDTSRLIVQLNPQSPQLVSNLLILLGGVYGRFESLLGRAPEQPKGHNPFDPQHNPGLHRIIISATRGTMPADAGGVLHGLHSLAPDSHPDGILPALQLQLAQLGEQIPALAYLSVLKAVPSRADKISVFIPQSLRDPQTQEPLNVRNIAGIASVIQEFLAPAVRDSGLQVAKPDEAMKSLDSNLPGGLGALL